MFLESSSKNKNKNYWNQNWINHKIFANRSSHINIPILVNLRKELNILITPYEFPLLSIFWHAFVLLTSPWLYKPSWVFFLFLFLQSYPCSFLDYNANECRYFILFHILLSLSVSLFWTKYLFSLLYHDVPPSKPFLLDPVYLVILVIFPSWHRFTHLNSCSVLLSGLAFPPLYFYSGGVRQFLATIKQHVFLVR